MANTAAVGGNIRFPSLQSIGNLFRSSINDTMNSTTGNGVGQGNTAGLIMSNQNPDLVTLMDSCIQDLYSDLRNVGDPELIIDNYTLAGLPALTTQDPSVQVALGYQGFFDGVQWYPQWTLPIGLSKMLAVWERAASTAPATSGSFQEMTAAPFGLSGCSQGTTMGSYEMREGMLWMPGATESVDLRIRARITYPEILFSAGLNYANTYVPIVDSKNAIVAKMKLIYSQRFSPTMYPMCVQEESRLMGKLKLEVVRGQQGNENERSSFGDEATGDFVATWSQL